MNDGTECIIHFFSPVFATRIWLLRSLVAMGSDCVRVCSVASTVLLLLLIALSKETIIFIYIFLCMYSTLFGIDFLFSILKINLRTHILFCEGYVYAHIV